MPFLQAENEMPQTTYLTVHTVFSNYSLKT